MKRKKKNHPGTIRAITVLLAVLAQLFLLGILVMHLRENYIYIFLALQIAGLVYALYLISRGYISAYVVAWITIILILPVFGYILFLLWGKSPVRPKKSRLIKEIVTKPVPAINDGGPLLESLSNNFPSATGYSKYLNNEGFPLYANTTSRYYPLGDFQFPDMMEDLRNARKFIFLEYFIVSDGIIWSEIYSILKKKSEEGVEVRILYDDFGSIFTLPPELKKPVKNSKIKIIAFNPVHRYIHRFYMNFRNHRKIAVIDGNIGYTGGTNLADEYANLIERFGHWKDNCIRLEGESVWTLTVTFLQMWQTETLKEESFRKYKPEPENIFEGFFQPFTDGPANNPQNPAEAMYKKMIYGAADYIYITTPYLVIDESMTRALILAAKSKTDVRIITPKKWDKWYVHAVTRSNYKKLIKNGVKIYEYTPGYIHSKTILCDDEHGIVGSINMDYRSFHLHFENGVWICGSPVLKEIKKDILATIEKSEEIHLETIANIPLYERAASALLRIFAPLF